MIIFIDFMLRTVLIADDHPVCLLGLKTLLNSRKESYQIVHEARNSDEVLTKLSIQPVDIIITDLCMPGANFPDGLRMVRQIVRDYPESITIVVTMIKNQAVHKFLENCGVKVVSKNDMLTTLLNVLSRSSRVIKSRSSTSTGLTKLLTPRETEVVRLLMSGMTVNSISDYLSRTKQTISAQKKSAMLKLGASNDFELFQCAYLAGLGSDAMLIEHKCSEGIR